MQIFFNPKEHCSLQQISFEPWDIAVISKPHSTKVGSVTTFCVRSEKKVFHIFDLRILCEWDGVALGTPPPQKKKIITFIYIRSYIVRRKFVLCCTVCPNVFLY